MNVDNPIEKYTIGSDKTILCALKKMDSNALRNLIVQSENRVVGVVTDGDIRRALLKGFKLEDPVSKAMNSPFIFLRQGDTPQKIINIFQKEAIGIAPILDRRGMLTNVMTRRTFEEMLLSKNIVTTDFKLEKYEHNTSEYPISSRPWGYYKTTVLNELFQSKVIYVLPKQSLSLQSHKRREEHWTIINGNGKIQLDESIRQVSSGDVVYIPKGCKHRITNLDEGEVLIFSEIQLGDYFGEDDIQRYEDVYGRS